MDTPWAECWKRSLHNFLTTASPSVPEMKMTGAEIVTLVKNAAQSGFVMALPHRSEGERSE